MIYFESEELPYEARCERCSEVIAEVQRRGPEEFAYLPAVDGPLEAVGISDRPGDINVRCPHCREEVVVDERVYELQYE